MSHTAFAGVFVRDKRRLISPKFKQFCYKDSILNAIAHDSDHWSGTSVLFQKTLKNLNALVMTMLKLYSFLAVCNEYTLALLQVLRHDWHSSSRSHMHNKNLRKLFILWLIQLTKSLFFHWGPSFIPISNCKVGTRLTLNKLHVFSRCSGFLFFV